MGTQEDIITRINNRLTMSANKTEGGFSQDIIGSVAYELANIYDTELNDIADKCFVATAAGDDLDRVASDYGMVRRQSQKAIVYLQITGTVGAIINQSVKAIYNNLVYVVTELKQIDSTGVAMVKAQCETSGSVGNVEANTITQFAMGYEGLISVTNPEPAYDGFDTEDDDTFRARIMLYLSEDAVNCNEAQYKQWALEVAGVKSVVIHDASHLEVGAGYVGVYISSTTGTVSEELKQAVKSYIEKRQFINAEVKMFAITNVSIDTTATVVLANDYTASGVEQEYTELLERYFEGLTVTVSYLKCSDILFSCSGVVDIVSFKLNNDEESISLLDTDIAVVGEVTINVA